MMTVHPASFKKLSTIYSWQKRAINELYMAMGDANEEEMNAMLEEVGELQSD